MYPVPLKIQEKEFKRDRRTLERAKDVIDRLGVSAFGSGALDDALEFLQKKTGSAGGTNMVYPVSARAQDKQNKRDFRVVVRAKEILQRLRLDQPTDGNVLSFALGALKRYEHDLKARRDGT